MRPGAARLLAALIGLAAAAGPAPAQEEVFVPHANLGQSGVRVFAGSASNDAAPVRTIAGAATGLTFPAGVAVDPCADEMVVTNANTALGQVGLRVFRRADQADVPPQRVIEGLATQLGDPQGVAVASAHGEIIVANLIGARPVTVHDRLATGNAPPVRSLGGPLTGLVQPWGVAFDDQRDEIIVASSGNASIRVFARSARDDTPPVRVIQGDQTGLVQVRGVAVDPARDVIAVADVAAAVRIFARTIGGNVAPLQTLAGLATPIGVAFGPASGDLFVTEGAPHNRVQVFARTGAGAYAFSRSIAGPSTGLAGPSLPAVALATLPPTTLVAAVLPLSRSVNLGGRVATAFVTIINTGPAVACQVGISLGIAPFPATLAFQPTDPLTNQPAAPPGTRVTIPSGGTATFVIAITPSAPFPPVDMPFQFAGANTLPVDAIVGVNTLLLSASVADVPDVIALVATASQDGIVRIPGAGGTAAFSVAAANVGIADTITVSADTGTASLPVTFLICETDPATAQCRSPLAPTVALAVAAGATPTFTILATASGPIAFDPAANRVFVRFRGQDGVVRGATGAALTTQ